MCVCDEEAAASNHKTQIPLGKLWQLKPALADALFIYFIVIFFRWQLKPALAYAMLLVIVGGVGLACVKEGKGRCPPRSPFVRFVCPPPLHSSLRFYLFLSDVSVNVGVVFKKSWCRIKKKPPITRHVLKKRKRGPWP